MPGQETKGAAQGELLAIVELGGYPDFSDIYRAAGYDVRVHNSMRRALAYLKKSTPEVVVAEFNYQSGFRDRLSNLESLMAAVQRCPGVRVVVFYEQDVEHQFARLQARFPFHAALSFPIDRERLKWVLKRNRDSRVYGP